MRIEQRSGLAATFLVHAKLHVFSATEGSTVEQQLQHAWEEARARWPTVALPAEQFVVYLAERLPEPHSREPLEALLQQLSLAELYLACACVRGQPGAITLFEQHYLARLPGLLRRPRQSESLLDDVCQLTRVKLLVPTPEGAPKLTEYTGRGSLLSWVRVTALRISTKLQAGEKPAPEEEAETLLESMPAPGVDAELDLIRRRHQADFRQAAHEAFGVLSEHERHLLRLHFVDQLSMYEMASLFRVNQSTVSRWLKGARQRIYEETRERLQARLGLSSREFQSFLAVLDSQFHLGLSQLLREESGGPRPLPKPD